MKMGQKDEREGVQWISSVYEKQEKRVLKLRKKALELKKNQIWEISRETWPSVFCLDAILFQQN
jgi:hypothetical protein